MKRKLMKILWLMVIISSYISSVFYTEYHTRYNPDYDEIDISFLIEKTEYTDYEYELIFMQTGLGKCAVDTLKNKADLLTFQKNFFDIPEYKCEIVTPVSFGERVTNGSVKFAPIQNGDVLVSLNSHVMSWRCGHAGIVVDAKEGTTLEAVVIGQNTKTQNITKWKKYPSFIILRLKDADNIEREEIANSAIEYLNDKPYRTFIGVYPKKYCCISEAKGTQCAHLVWMAYAANGYDIDSNKGLVVTPHDIMNSDLFEIVQVYGIKTNYR